MNKMNNAVIINNGLVLSSVLTMSEAVARLEQLKVIYPNAYIQETDQPVKSKFVHEDYEEIEDKGCAGGACTL